MRGTATQRVAFLVPFLTYLVEAWIVSRTYTSRMSKTGNNNNNSNNTDSMMRMRFQQRSAASYSAMEEESVPPINSFLQRSKFHHLTVCMVPPESSEFVWEMLTKCRTELRDPGLFRWPPHVNLLYPFLDIQSESNVRRDVVSDTTTSTRSSDITDVINTTNEFPTVHPEIIQGLVAACSQCAPFRVRLQRFDTFGNKNRGVLWLHPESSPIICDGSSRIDDEWAMSSNDSNAPLMQLQSLLVQSFPTCDDQNRKSSAGIFQPHMTVSHFPSLDDALAKQQQIEAWWPITTDSSLSFRVDCIYLLQRTGDSGQFLRVVDIPLGTNTIVREDSTGTSSVSTCVVHDPPVPFRHMPTSEESWVLDERMQLKRRRNVRYSNGGNPRERSNRANPNRVMDSPDVIEAKRAARKSKRESK